MSEQGQRIIEAVRAVADRMPLHIQRGLCQYVADGAPRCLFGHALWDLGLIDADLEARSYNGEPIRALLGAVLSVEVDSAEARWMEHAQSAQDESFMWGAAVRGADVALGDAVTGEQASRKFAYSVAAEAIHSQDVVPGLSPYVAGLIAEITVNALLANDAVDL